MRTEITSNWTGVKCGWRENRALTSPARLRSTVCEEEVGEKCCMTEDVMAKYNTLSTYRENWYFNIQPCSYCSHRHDARLTAHTTDNKNFKHIYFNTSIINSGEGEVSVVSLFYKMLKWLYKEAWCGISKQASNWIPNFSCSRFIY